MSYIPPPIPRPLLTAGLIALWLALPPGVAQAAGPVSKEYQLKAAFLYNFVKFVEWPPKSFGNGNSPLIVGVVGSNPFGEELGNAIRGREMGGRQIVVKFAPDPAGAKGSHVIFIPASMSGRTAELNRLFGAGVLIVGDTRETVGRGATIAFKQEGDKLRFAVDLGEAGRDGLKIRAQLLKLASEIQR